MGRHKHSTKKTMEATDTESKVKKRRSRSKDAEKKRRQSHMLKWNQQILLFENFAIRLDGEKGREQMNDENKLMLLALKAELRCKIEG